MSQGGSALRAGVGPFLALWLALAGALVGCSEPGPPPKRHAVLIVIDTLRRDALEHARTPAIDSLVARGQLAPLAWSSDTWTGGSVVSLFTGLHLREHGWIQDFPDRGQEPWGPMPVLPPVPMLAEVMRDAGFDTAGYYANHVLSWELGFDRGFDHWEFARDEELPGKVARDLLGWDQRKRRFLYVHFLGPHLPIDPSSAARKRWNLRRRVYNNRFVGARIDVARHAEDLEERRRAYYAAVEDTDEQLGRLLRFLEPHFDDTALVLTSDHGEMLAEHAYWGHGRQVFESLTRVPFVAVNTGPVPERINNAVTADLLTRAVGVEHGWGVQVDERGPLVSRHKLQLAISEDGRAKGIWNKGGHMEVHDMAGYPNEKRGFEDRRQSLIEARERYEREVKQGTTASQEVEADEDLIEALRALGYVGE